MANTSRSQATAETREHILDVARREFYAKGYDGASINAIVDATHVTKPTVYYHFKNKAALFAALVEDAFSRFIDHRQASLSADMTAGEQVAAVIAADFAFCLECPDLVRFALALIFSLPEATPVNVQEVFDKDHAFYRAVIERGIERGEFATADPRDAAMALQGVITINVLSFLTMGHSPEFLSPARASDLARVLLEGLLPAGSAAHANRSNNDEKEMPR